MLRSICVLVLAMSAFAGSLAADTQQQCSDVVPDVNLARNDPPKEVEGVTITGNITGNKMTLKTGYSFVRMPGGVVAVQETATRRGVASYSCGCPAGGSGGCEEVIFADTWVWCWTRTCNSGCGFLAHPPKSPTDGGPTRGGGQPSGGVQQRVPDQQMRR